MEGPIDQYHDWFQLAISMWLNLAKLKAIKRIKKAVELDEVGCAIHVSGVALYGLRVALEEKPLFLLDNLLMYSYEFLQS